MYMRDNCITFVPELGSPAKSALDDHLNKRQRKNIILHYAILLLLLNISLNLINNDDYCYHFF